MWNTPQTWIFPWEPDTLYCGQGRHEVLQSDRKQTVHAFQEPPHQQTDAGAHHA